MARVTDEYIDALDMPEAEKKRLKKMAKLGLTQVELEGILELNEYTPVVITYDIRTNASLSDDQLDELIAEFRKDVQNGMMAREVGVLFLKGLGLAAKAAAAGAL
jgi:hypothetical protein